MRVPTLLHRQRQVMQPDFQLYGSEIEKIFWDGLEGVFQFVGEVTVDFLIICHEAFSDQETVSFAADLHIEATLLKYAERMKTLSWEIDEKFSQVYNFQFMAESLTDHPGLEDLFDLDVDVLKTNDEARRALSRAIVSIPNLHPSASILCCSNQLLHPDFLGWCVCYTKNVKWSIMDLTRSDSFFDALASKDATLESLDINDDCKAFDDLHSDVALAEKLTRALNSNASLQSLRYSTPYCRYVTPPRPDRPNEHRDAGSLLGKALARHPTLEKLELHFAWHSTFYEGILAGLSTIQGWDKQLTLRFFQGTCEQCAALVQVLQHGCIKRLTIIQSELNDPDNFLRLLMGCTSTNLKELLMEEVEGAATFSTFVEFIGAVKLQLISLDLCIIGEDFGFGSSTFIHAVTCNFDLCCFPVDRLREADNWRSFLSSEIRKIINGILVMNKAGRRYLLTDPWTKEKGVTALAAAADRLDCLFLHLRENPSLCSGALSQDQCINS